jgi:hypothetical protein
MNLDTAIEVLTGSELCDALGLTTAEEDAVICRGRNAVRAQMLRHREVRADRLNALDQEAVLTAADLVENILAKMPTKTAQDRAEDTGNDDPRARVFMVSTLSLRRCKRCGGDFPPTREYYKSAKCAKDGLMTICRTCYNARQRQSWAEDRNGCRTRALARRAILRQNPESTVQTRERARRYYQTHKEHARAYYREHRDKIIAQAKAWQAANKERDNALRRARYQQQRQTQRGESPNLQPR